jgi:DEAD/DEAH box helicase domain-containing protein
MPAISGADSTEIGGISYPDGRIIYYEGVEGGVGLSQILVKKYEKCINMAYERLKKCDCENGCPKCVYSPQCSNNNFYIDKKKAIEIIEKAIHKNY